MGVEILVILSPGASYFAAFSPIHWKLSLSRLIDQTGKVASHQGRSSVSVRPLQLVASILASPARRTDEPVRQQAGERSAVSPDSYRCQHAQAKREQQNQPYPFDDSLSVISSHRGQLRSERRTR